MRSESCGNFDWKFQSTSIHFDFENGGSKQISINSNSLSIVVFAATTLRSAQLLKNLEKRRNYTDRDRDTP